jgi:PKD repeat protein
VKYNILTLTDDVVDTLVVEGRYQWDLNDPGGYWRFVLVHYDDPNQEPPIPGPKPQAGFDMVVNGNTITCTNTTTDGVSYLWEFGDGESSTATDVVHTYAYDGFYNISLTATNPNGESTAVKALFLSITSPALTADMLAGAAWRPVVGEKTIFVGPTMGSSEWWAVPKNFLTGGGTGGDDWSCIVDDEFTFKAGGEYTYDGKGTVRNDGYFGSPNGCWDESTLTGNAAYFKSGTHSWAFTPAAGGANAIIVLTNGPDRAAFLGFYKGYYGGENTNSANPPNGGNPTNQYEVMGYAHGTTKEYLFVSVDLDGAGEGTSSWSVILER